MKYFEINEEIEKMFDEVLNKTSIPNWVEIKLFGDNNLKNEKGYVIKKQSEFNEYIGDGINIALILNEEIFEGLDSENQLLLIEEALTSVHVSDTDKISVEDYDFKTHSGMMIKHGDNKMIKLGESVKSLIKLKKIKEDELKNSKKEK